LQSLNVYKFTTQSRDLALFKQVSILRDHLTTSDIINGNHQRKSEMLDSPVPSTHDEFAALIQNHYNYTGILFAKSKEQYNDRLIKFEPHPIPMLFREGANHYDYPSCTDVAAKDTAILRKLRKLGSPGYGYSETITNIKPRHIQKRQFGLIQDGIAHFPWTMTGSFLLYNVSSAEEFHICLLRRAFGRSKRLVKSNLIRSRSSK
jgi:hypothetical protein